ncbi:asparaginase [Erythrobacter arachoides]|uniref:Asparaginase n=1 Tax=Aurantiacibacter arachoides TaxID=1850444 RepID=A0A845A8B5_9SPHN|nr:asparaginase [Aurantiacibacter arachoides]MXO93779.1 asparaginase [Aurantiacibacter arachoides]GGD46720.1 L-asparaginase [Aurantiacibacter arachoides]
MTDTSILVLATGGTIAGQAGSATRRDYRPGQIEIADFLASFAELGVTARLDGRQVANIDSVDIGPAIWRDLHSACIGATRDPQCGGVIVTHGTDSAEETAFLLDQTLPTAKPVVLVGAMRPADAVGSDGLRNFANAVRVAADPQAAGRGVLLVMGDQVFAARDARKARTSGASAFAGFPRGPIALATPASLDWLSPPWREDEAARFAFPDTFPRVPILHAYAGMDADAVQRELAAGAKGIVLAGMGSGNAPAAVLAALAEAVRRCVPVVRSTRVDEGLVDREPEDETNGFIAARALGPAKARVLLQLLVASGVSDPAAAQAAFDRR